MNHNKYLNYQEFVDNTAKRIPVCIVVDCSGSMKEYDNTSKSRINRVNDGIELFYDGVRKNIKAKRAVDVLIIQVGNNANVISEFANTDINPPKLEYQAEKNNLTEGIELALEKLDERKQIYKSADIDYYQPWLLVMSDGGVNREFSKANFRKAQAEVRKREADGKLTVFPIYVQGKPVFDKYEQKYVPIKPETYDHRLELMSAFSNNKDRLIDIDLADGRSFEDLFQFLHKSASSVANNKGIIKDSKYGNFQQTCSNNVNNKVELYQYIETQPADVVEEIQDIDDSKAAEELLRQQQIEQERIKQARKELVTDLTHIIEKKHLTKTIKNSIDMLVNGSKAFPIKKNEGGKIILTIQLGNDDRVVLIKNNSSTIYDEVFQSEGRYEFVISDNNIVDVIKCEVIGKTSDKNQRIKNMNKEIEDAIYNISDWDKI